MKGRVLFLLLLSACSCSVHAQQKGFGLGVIIGEPTGLSAKNWVSSRNAVDAGLAWSFRHSGFFHVHADYLWHTPRDSEVPGTLAFSVGAGGRLGVKPGSVLVGVRVPLGIVYWPRDTPLDFFLEVAPVLDLAPTTELSANGGIGARFFFH
jgi:hypothetical protein